MFQEINSAKKIGGLVLGWSIGKGIIFDKYVRLLREASPDHRTIGVRPFDLRAESASVDEATLYQLKLEQRYSLLVVPDTTFVLFGGPGDLHIAVRAPRSIIVGRGEEIRRP